MSLEQEVYVGDLRVGGALIRDRYSMAGHAAPDPRMTCNRFFPFFLQLRELRDRPVAIPWAANAPAAFGWLSYAG